MLETYNAAANPEAYQQNNKLHVLFAGESQTHPQHKLGPKVYDYFLLHYVESGKGQFVNETALYELTEGDCFLIHPEQLVSYASDAVHPWRYRWIAFTGEYAAELVAQTGLSPQLPVFHTDEDSLIPELLSNVLHTYRNHKSSSHLLSIGCLYQLMAEAKEVLLKASSLPSGKSGLQKKIVKQMIHYISSQYAYPVSIEQMCASLGYNRAYLSRVFKKETGITPVTYLLKLRIAKSRELLRGRPELSIEQVAASVGITDALYFSRQFHRFHGQSPSQFRKSVTTFTDDLTT